jgi:hypothetical protein
MRLNHDDDDDDDNNNNKKKYVESMVHQRFYNKQWQYSHKKVSGTHFWMR